MTNETDEKEELTAGLTEEQKRLLESTLKDVEHRIFWAVLRTLKIYIGAALVFTVAVFAMLGFLTFSGIRSDVVKKASDTLAESPDVKNEVLRKAKEDFENDTKLIETAGELVEKLKAAEERLDEADTRLKAAEALLARTVSKKFRDVHEMIKQIKEDVAVLGSKRERSRVKTDEKAE